MNMKLNTTPPLANYKSWKQPIAVEISPIKGNVFATTVFQKLLIRCSNEDRTVYIDDITPIELHRGQCVVGRYELAKCFGLKRNESGRVRTVLDKLENSAKLITKQKSLNCSIVTILNYDNWVEMTKLETNHQPNESQSIATNKSEESVKTEKFDWTPEAINALQELGGVSL